MNSFFLVLLFLVFAFVIGPLLIEGFPTPVSTRHTRNMSYDIRGDPVRIPMYYHGPWGMSSLAV